MVQDGRPLTPTQALDHHRKFWEEVCQHPQPQQECDTVRALLAALPDDLPQTQLTLEHIKCGLARLRSHTAAGLDGWTTDALRHLSDEALHCFACCVSI